MAAAAYTLIVGTRSWSSWSLRPYMALKAAGVAFQTVDIALRRPGTKAEILRHSPSGKIPLLKIEPASSSEAAGHQKMGGKTLAVWDSLAICETIAERHPEAGLWPADADARAIACAYACEMHSGFPDIRDQLGMEFARRLPLPELRGDTKIQLARIIAAWQSALETWKGDFLFGDTLSVADCMYAPVVSRFVTYNVALPPIVQAYVARVFALPAMTEWGAAAQKEVEAGLPCPDSRSPPASESCASERSTRRDLFQLR